METNRRNHQVDRRKTEVEHGETDSHLGENPQVQGPMEDQMEMVTAISRAMVTGQIRSRPHRLKHRHRNLPADPVTHLETLTTRREILLVAH